MISVLKRLEKSINPLCAHAFVSAFLVALCMSGNAVAQSAARAPRTTAAPLPPADFSGIWASNSGGASALRGHLPYNTEWQAKWDAIRDRSLKGLPIEDGTSKCLPPGMPRFLLFAYPVEILMTPGQVTLMAEYFSENRRIFTDGRKHPPDDELEPTFRGHSIGQWRGKTLVVDTIGIRTDTYFSSYGQPHSDKLHITERLHLQDANNLIWDVTVEDALAFEKPLTFTLKLNRAQAGDEIREYVCQENNAKTVDVEKLNISN